MVELFIEYRDEAQRIISVLLALMILRWGGGPERVVALLFVLLFTMPNVVIDWFSSEGSASAETTAHYILLDIIAAIAFVTLAVQANRNYTLGVAAFQLVAVSAHGVRYVTDAVTPLAHAVMVIGPSYFQLILMAIGLVRHVGRKRQHGEYRDWRLQRRDIDFSALIREQS